MRVLRGSVSPTCKKYTADRDCSRALQIVFIIILKWGFCPRHLLAQSLKEPPPSRGVMVAQEALTLLVSVRVVAGRPTDRCSSTWQSSDTYRQPLVCCGFNSRHLSTIKHRTMEIKFKKLDPRAVAPVRGHESDAGFDLVATRITT